MRSLNRREIVALWLAGALLIASPAIAHHVNEPSAALIGIEFKVGDYATHTQVECGDTVDFDVLRVEQIATVEAKPSEHWTTRFEWKNPRGFGTPYLLWPHQNIGPHGHANIGHASIPLFALGEYRIRMVSTGDASGNRIEVTCSIYKG